MKQLYNLVTFCFVAICLLFNTSCGSNQASDYSAYVDYCTRGVISYQAPATMTLTTAVSPALQEKYPASKRMSIEPKVEGTFSFADDYTVVFKPTNGFARNTSYTIKAELDDWFESDTDIPDFQFSFSTMPLSVSAYLKSMDVTNDDSYQMVFDVTTSDQVDNAELEKLVTVSEQCNLSWGHVAGGNKHELTVNVAANQNARTLRISTPGQPTYGLEAGDLVSTDIPSKNTMSVYSVECHNGDQRYVEVVFTKNLDSKQKMMGLAYIEGNKSKSADVRGNKIRLYPDASARGQQTIFLSSAIRSAGGIQLGSDQKHTVELEALMPKVKFVSEGVIVPLTGEVSIPFSAVMMKGVRVKIFRIYQNNIGQILQTSTIQSVSNLKYVSRPVAVQTLFFDGNSFDQWKTYAINLSDLIKVSPGDMYRVELDLDYDLSAWPEATTPRRTREEIEAVDKQVLASLNDKANTSSWYFDDYDSWQDYDWEDRENPATRSYYANKNVAKSVFTTNIGLISMRGQQQQIKVFATDITTAKPISGVTVEAYNMQNQIVASGSTDSDGEVELAYTSAKGVPYYILARKGDDLSCLSVSDNSAISTSTFDVSGKEVQNGLKGYIYGERGVWRPGDTLHISFMLSDRQKSLPDNHPVTLEVQNPLGQTQFRATKTEGALGLYSFNVPTSPDAQTGAWNATVSVGGNKFYKSLRVETVKPNRLKININMPERITKGMSSNALLHTEWLSGARAGNLKYTVEADYAKTKTTFNGYSDYEFDDPSRYFYTDHQTIAEGRVNESGDASVSLSNDDSYTSPGMLKMSITTRVYEESGEFSVDGSSALYSPYKRYIGIKAPKSQGCLDTGKDHVFDVVVVNSNGQPVPGVKLDLRVFKVQWYWWWNSSSSDLANFIEDEYQSPYSTGTLTSDANGKAAFSMNFPDDDWGTYFFTVADGNSGHRTGIKAYFDWPTMYGKRSFDGRDAASILSLTTDKQEYSVGDDIRVTFPSSAGSRAIVSVCNGSSVLSSSFYECKEGTTSVSIKATDEMRPNVYIQVSEVQPYERTKNDMPIRMFGIAPVTVSSANSVLTPVIDIKDEIRPESTVEVTVSEQKGRKMAYTLAIVDEGLLDLTHFKTPNGWDLFNAREALGVRTWDLYDMVAGAYGGRIERLFSIGGDDFMQSGPKSIVNRFTPMVYFAGPFVSDGKKKHKVQIPNYNGRVRVMVVAGNGEAFGCAEKSVKVTKPIMLIPTMPRQIGVNDEATVSATIFTNSSASGNVKASISCTGGAQIVGDDTKTVSIPANDNVTVNFRIKMDETAKDCIVTIKAKGSGDEAEVSTKLTVRRVTQKVTKSETYSVAPGQSQEATLNGDEIMAEVSGLEPFNIGPRTSQLLAYPHGCAEQITSKALPQLYLSQFTELTDAQKQQVESNVKSVISRIVNYQTSEGGMSYWPGSNYSHVWASAYVYLFLTEAESQGYFVNSDLKNKLGNYLTKAVKTWNSKYYATDYAFALFSLANASNPEMGTMNRMKESQSNLNNEAKVNLAAAYALIGHNDVAKDLISKTFGDGVPVRLVAQCKLGSGNGKSDADAIRKQLISDSWMSTRETALSLYAMSKYVTANPVASSMEFTAKVNSDKVADVETEKMFWQNNIANDIRNGKFSFKNSGKSALNVRLVSVTDVTQQEVVSNSNGLSVSVSYQSESGANIDVTSLPQGQTFKAVVAVRNTSTKNVENIAVTHVLPAGWEILKATGSDGISYQDVRDDRVLSYIDLLHNGSVNYITLNISATYAGQYYMPSISAEAMYDNTITGCTHSSMVTVGE